MFRIEVPVIESLSGSELLERVYTELFFEQVKGIREFEKPVEVLVAEDRDLGRIDRGTMKYKKGKVVSINDKDLLVARGTPARSYVATDRYMGDIRISEDGFPEWLVPLMSSIYPFWNSALVIYRGGGVGIPKDGPFSGLGDLVDKAKMSDITIGKPGPSRYKTEFADICVERIEAEVRRMSSAI